VPRRRARRACRPWWPAFDGCLFCLGVTVRSGEHFADEHWTGMEPVTTIHDIGALPRTLRLLEEP